MQGSKRWCEGGKGNSLASNKMSYGHIYIYYTTTQHKLNHTSQIHYLIIPQQFRKESLKGIIAS